MEIEEVRIGQKLICIIPSRTEIGTRLIVQAISCKDNEFLSMNGGWFNAMDFKPYFEETKEKQKETTVLQRAELNAAVIEKLDNIKKLFGDKNDQYATTKDCLSNFTLGAKLMGYEGNYIGRYEALKAYVAKHIAQVYDNKLTGPKVDESLQDIAVYSIIALVMLDEEKKEKKRLRGEAVING